MGRGVGVDGGWKVHSFGANLTGGHCLMLQTLLSRVGRFVEGTEYKPVHLIVKLFPFALKIPFDPHPIPAVLIPVVGCIVECLVH